MAESSTTVNMTCETEVGSLINEAMNQFFPNGIRVLAVDDDAFCLKVLERLLLSCGYQVTTSQQATTALQLLREKKGNFDIVISDVKMPGMDGFKLLEIVVVEMDLPVIMLSVDSEVSTVMKGIEHGACDYLLKPARVQELMFIWKHVMKKSLHDTKGASATNKPDAVVKSEEDNISKHNRKGKDQIQEKEDESDESSEELSTQKRPRVAWTEKLHKKFIAAVNKLGLDRAVPKKILDLMNVPGLARENVASHLQKYRKALKKNGIEATQQYHGGVGASGFVGANMTSSVLLSFNSQGPNISRPPVGFRVEGYQNHQRTIPFAYGQQSSMGAGNRWLPLPLSSQSNLGQHYLSTPQPSPLRAHQFCYASNPLAIEAGTPQSTSMHASYQPLVPRLLEQPSSSQIRWPRETFSSPCSINQPGHSTNPQVVDSVFEQNNLQNVDFEDPVAAGLDGMPSLHGQHQPLEFHAQTDEDLGLESQIDGTSMEPERNEQKQSEETSSSELLVPFLDPSHEECMFHLSDGHSAEDLHTAIKQFQAPEEIAKEVDH